MSCGTEVCLELIELRGSTALFVTIMLAARWLQSTVMPTSEAVDFAMVIAWGWASLGAVYAAHRNLSYIMMNVFVDKSKFTAPRLRAWLDVHNELRVGRKVSIAHRLFDLTANQEYEEGLRRQISGTPRLGRPGSLKDRIVQPILQSTPASLFRRSTSRLNDLRGVGTPDSAESPSTSRSSTMTYEEVLEAQPPIQPLARPVLRLSLANIKSLPGKVDVERVNTGEKTSKSYNENSGESKNNLGNGDDSDNSDNGDSDSSLQLQSLSSSEDSLDEISPVGNMIKQHVGKGHFEALRRMSTIERARRESETGSFSRMRSRSRRSLLDKNERKPSIFDELSTKVGFVIVAAHPQSSQ